MLAGLQQQGSGYALQFLGEISFCLTAVDADTHNGPIYKSVGIYGHFRENTAQFFFPADQIIDPLDAGPKTGGLLHSVAHGPGHGAGQVHQFRSRTVRPEDQTHIDSAVFRGMERSSHAATALGLILRQDHSTLRGTLPGQGLSQIIGGGQGVIYLNQTSPGVVFRQQFM